MSQLDAAGTRLHDRDEEGDRGRRRLRARRPEGHRHRRDRDRRASSRATTGRPRRWSSRREGGDWRATSLERLASAARAFAATSSSRNVLVAEARRRPPTRGRRREASSAAICDAVLACERRGGARGTRARRRRRRCDTALTSHVAARPGVDVGSASLTRGRSPWRSRTTWLPAARSPIRWLRGVMKITVIPTA